MDSFAKDFLLKYGWTEGKGLGKNESGIAEALKPSLKNDKSGIGYKETDTKNWWETSFNNAAKNIKIESQDGQVSLSVDNDKKILSPKKNEKTKQGYYGIFVKTSTLVNGQLVQDASAKSQKKITIEDPGYVPLTDEQLYQTCGGRTAHKTARHALTLSGKLQRIAEQDMMFPSTNTKTQTLNASPVIKYPILHRKTKAESDIEENEYEKDGDEDKSQSEVEYVDTRSKSTKKKQKKKINKLADQLNNCGLQDKEAESILAQELNSCTLIENELHEKTKKNKSKRAVPTLLRDSLKDEMKNNTHQISICINEDMEMMTKQKNILKSEKVDEEMAYFHRALRKKKTRSRKEELRELKLQLLPTNFKELENCTSERECKRAKYWDRCDCLIGIESEDTKEDMYFSKPKKFKKDSLFKPVDTDVHLMTSDANSVDFLQLPYKRQVKLQRRKKQGAKHKIEDKKKNYCQQETSPLDKYDINFFRRSHNSTASLKELSAINKKILKGKRKKKMEKVIEKLINKHLANDLNDVIKNLTAVDLTEEIVEIVSSQAKSVKAMDAYPRMLLNANCQEVVQEMESHLSLRMDSEQNGMLAHIKDPIWPELQILLPIFVQKMPCL